MAKGGIGKALVKSPASKANSSARLAIKAKQADMARTVRRRYTRAADRLEKQAGKATGLTQQMLESQASQMREYAQQFTMKNIRNRYSNEDIWSVLKTISHDSTGIMAKATQAQREEQLGVIMLSNESTASSFYGATIDIWRGLQGQARDEAIIEFFGVDNIYQAMQLLSEETNQNIFGVDSEYEKYTGFLDAGRTEVASRMALG